MNDTTAAKLLQLNADFYQAFARQFSETRQQLQPGVRRILDSIGLESNILDLGCGNGELARDLARQGFRGQYQGVDFSAALLEVARQGVADHENFSFVQGNLAAGDWVDTVTLRYRSHVSGLSQKFDHILAFAVLHHLPGERIRRQILRTLRALLDPKGTFIHSNWQFLNSPRLHKRIHPWNEIGLTGVEVDPGDYLLDWRRGGFGLRYVHHFSKSELHSLASETGFRVLETFHSDGESGDLGLYQIWENDI